MKCKKCNEEINVHVFGQPDDICWACVSDKEKLWDIVKDLIITKFKTALSKN